ncbi:hypothetical protein GCM10010140_59270 [Streptosporangium pseudovulgare]|uniref:Uncharacterized protein n=1 Tax=Streptosporangium pseudovulgare TaxID=35765 RepID=A0ABQ2R9S7_9ACTN|nr:hypothetical protein GCM10010140_59270 [Streptosporangium pseudovulgare]
MDPANPAKPADPTDSADPADLTAGSPPCAPYGSPGTDPAGKRDGSPAMAGEPSAPGADPRVRAVTYLEARR